MTEKRLTVADQFKVQMSGEYLKQVKNYLGGDEKRALRFMTALVHSANKTPKLYECDRQSLLEAGLTCAQFDLFPSSAGGEAYILPYKGKAKFQLGYPGIVTLLYRAGNKEVIAELVREKDKFAIRRGKVFHEVDPRKTKEERGDWIGAYAIITTAAGGTVEGYMAKKDILAHAKQFSQSFNSEHSPWKPENDPEGWMPRKTVLTQVSKLAPKNDTIMEALARDYEDSTINNRRRIDPAALKAGAPTIGSLTKGHGKTNKDPDETEGAQAESLFDGVADNHPEEASIG